MTNLNNIYEVAKAILAKIGAAAGEYTGGSNISISDENVITAKGYTVDLEDNVTITEDLTVNGDAYLPPVVYWNDKYIPTPPTTDGHYKLECWVENGVQQFNWYPVE